MQQGIVVKAYNGYYYVQDNQKVVECKLRGRFKKERFSLVVGDKVLFEACEKCKGVIEEILPRQSMLLRPVVANVDQVVVVFSVAYPDFDQGLIDRFLVLAEASGLEPILCITKMDLADVSEIMGIVAMYSRIGYKVYTVSAVTGIGISELCKTLYDKVSVLSGPSGVGKSTLLNAIEPGLELATGELSKKNSRGRHTTRFAQLLLLSAGGFIVDTPGFSFTEFTDFPLNELSGCFPEMAELSSQCKFSTCLHNCETQCVVKTAVNAGLIARERYYSYLEILNELNDNKKGY